MKKDPFFYLWPLSVTFTLVLQTCVLHATHHLRIVNISAESFQNPSRNGKVMAGTKKKTLFFTFDLCVTLTLELQPWVLGATYFSWMSTILPIKSFQNPSRNGSYGRCEKKKDTIFYLWPLSVTLTFAIQTWGLCVTHCIMMVNVSAKSL